MSREEKFAIKWVRLSEKAQGVYSLPALVPWPSDAAPPGAEDFYINLSALGAACTMGNNLAKKWGDVGTFCRNAEEASAKMENFEYLEALDLLEEAERANACSYIHWQRCVCHLELKHGGQALAAIDHAARGAEENPAFWRIKAEIELAEGLEEESEESFETAFQKGDRSASVVNAMKRCGKLNVVGGDSETLVSSDVASAVLKVRAESVLRVKGGRPRLAEILEEALELKQGASSVVRGALFLGGNPDATPRENLLSCLVFHRTGHEEESLHLAEKVTKATEQSLKQDQGVLSTLDLYHLIEMFKSVMKMGNDEISSRLKNMGEKVWGWDDGEAYFPLFPKNGKKEEILEIAELLDLPGGWIEAAELLSAKNEKNAAKQAAEKAVADTSSPDILKAAAKIMIAVDESEKACAYINRIKEIDRDEFANFLFGEALWRIGQPEMALSSFYKAQDSEDKSIQTNSQMRNAQCQGHLVALPESIELSPTGRLGKPLLISSGGNMTVLAPMGVSAASYIKSQLPTETAPCTYRVFEFSKTHGEVPLAELIVKGKHDTVALAIEPGGTVFAGARMGEKWVPVNVEKN